MENQCTFPDEIRLDNVTYFNEWNQIIWPYFLSSFGLGIPRDYGCFQKRKFIRVTGKYCDRTISLYYNKRNKQRLGPVISKIEENAKRIGDIDREIYKAVSYTHLDVYKRQISAWACSSVWKF